MRRDIVKYFTDWKTVYLIWIVCSWLLTNKPSPNYYGYLFEEYELAWWIWLYYHIDCGLAFIQKKLDAGNLIVFAICSA